MYFRLSSCDRIAIRWALSKDAPWDVDGKKSPYRNDPRAKRIQQLKDKLKAFHLANQDNRCCYCRTILKSRSIETDREHIIPKDIFKSLTFHAFNLSIACKTCNMTNKNKKTTHLRGFRKTGALISKNLKDPRNYNIVHPNIHDWTDHIQLRSEDDGRSAVTIYRPITLRGRFTYEFFDLKALEIYQNYQDQKSPATKKVSRSLHPSIVALEAEFKQR